ncbi:hypothetical protein M1D30_03595 [Prevotella sp. E15-22]|uniref:hypothetical protein n=1 Tax=Prevotella sp. E15-22 TaxID=2937774 RepID=UPI002063BBD8|nr:hypothetical protein [Prevotella sp. E15-22]UPS45265.1 hypothetical protein M1D30_03595 [Prevotella sp. E15-22]
MDTKFIDKNILLIAPKFFGYEYEIIKELERRGSKVYYVQENIDSSSFREKIINKLPKQQQKEIRQNYFIERFRKNIPSSVCIDYVFGIRMDLLAEDALSYLRKTYPRARYICYFWDSSKNMRNAELVASYFDKVLTFDRADTNKHEGWIFRPLFFINAYERCKKLEGKDLDILFVGSLMPKRAELYLWLKDFCAENRLSLYAYFYCKVFVYLANYFKQSLYKKLPSSIVHNKGLLQERLIGLFESSNVIFDCSSPSQSGLTMRTIECLGARKKMITTNTDIANYDFYNPRNIFIFDPKRRQEMLEFVKDRTYQDLSPKQYEYYSIRGWIDSIFE